MVLKGMMTRPSGSHRDQLVLAAIELSNRLAPGHSNGVRFDPTDDPLEAVTTANDVCDLFYRKQTPFEVADAAQLWLLAERLHEVLLDLGRGDLPTAVPKINALLAEYPAQLHLSSEPPWSLHYQDHDATAVEGWQVGCCAALASWVSSGATAYISVCGADRCDRVFFDDTRSGTRRFCSPRCQNRHKVQAFRLRQAINRAR
ncbi:MAG: CGNR zinc finger domain-containing protein [Humibacter sp.]